MKVNTRVCDICGNDIYRHGRSAYKITKHKWEVDFFPKRMDLCADCYRRTERFIEDYFEKGDIDADSD